MLSAIILVLLAAGDFRAAQSQRRLAGHIERWDKRGWAEDAELAMAAQAARSLVADLPRSADAWMRVGRVYEYWAFSQRFWPEPYRRQLASAVSCHGAAVGLRPSSATAWLSFARTSLALGGVDARFEQALTRAVALAPWDAAVLQEAIPLASRAWDGLSEEARRAVAVGTRNALQHYRTQGLWQEAAQRLGWDRFVDPGMFVPDRHGPRRS